MFAFTSEVGQCEDVDSIHFSYAKERCSFGGLQFITLLRFLLLFAHKQDQARFDLSQYYPSLIFHMISIHITCLTH